MFDSKLLMNHSHSDESPGRNLIKKSKFPNFTSTAEGFNANLDAMSPEDMSFRQQVSDPSQNQDSGDNTLVGPGPTELVKTDSQEKPYTVPGRFGVVKEPPAPQGDKKTKVKVDAVFGNVL